MLGEELELLHGQLKADTRTKTLLLQAQIQAQKQLKEQKMHIKELKCSWCDKFITDEHKHFYQCIYHGDIFCDNCAKNNYKAEIDWKEASKCKKKLFDKSTIDCIWQKRFTELKDEDTI